MATEPDGSSVLAALRDGLGREGLHLVLPLDGAAYDAAVAGTAAPRLAELLAGAAGAVIVGDGGPTFFARFRAAVGAGRAAPRHPLDEFTRTCVRRAVAAALGPGGPAARVLFPFANELPALPFQRLGQAAGLPPPGPLGLQIHPRFGPWWAYRALVVVAQALALEPALARSCDGCPAPCRTACPVGAPSPPATFDYARCRSRRLADAAAEAGGVSPPSAGAARASTSASTATVAGGCVRTCAARNACPVGDAWRYPDEQLAFHMAASLPGPLPPARA